ncbi:unnamed protein product [Rhodiola kirilowii]
MKSKGWVESIYQTFENVCDDLDSTMSQAPMKYVGNPVQTVGKGVKKFCSSVMQDFLPAQVNSGKVDIPKASTEEGEYIEGYIYSSNVEGNELYLNGEQPVEEHGADNGLNQGTENFIQSSFSVERRESNVGETSTFCTSSDIGMISVITPDAQMNVSSHSTVTESAFSPMVENPHAEGSIFHDYEHIETPHDGSDRSSTLESAKGVFKSYTNDLEDALLNSIKPPNVAVVDVPTNDFVSKPVGKLVHTELLQRGNSSNFSTFSSESNDVDPFEVSVSETLSHSSGSMVEQGWESSTLESSMTFSDICISDDMCTDSDPLAEAFSVDDIKLRQSDLLINRHAHFPSSQRGPSLKSYKKLLQDTLNSKRRRVKEYKQLGIWQGDIYEKHDYNESTTSTQRSKQLVTPSNSEDITTAQKQNLSEWELL